MLNGFGRVGIFRIAREISVRLVSRRSGSTRWRRLQTGSKFVRTWVSSLFCQPSREVSRIRASSLASGLLRVQALPEADLQRLACDMDAERARGGGDRAGQRIDPATLFLKAFFT